MPMDSTTASPNGVSGAVNENGDKDHNRVDTTSSSDKRCGISGSNHVDFMLPKPRDSSNSSSPLQLQSTKDQIYKMAPESIDPAILSCSSASMRRYSRSALLLLRDEELSNVRPDCIDDPRFFRLGFWRPDGGMSDDDDEEMLFGKNSRFSSSKMKLDHRSISSAHLMPAFLKRRSTGATNGMATKDIATVAGQQHSRSSQNIVLSPQRKSINMGCQLPMAPQSGHQHAATSLWGDHDMPDTLHERRFGSGRLPPRDVRWDYRPDKEAPSDGQQEQEIHAEAYNKRGRSSDGGHRYSSSYRSSNGGRSDYREHHYERRSLGRYNSDGYDYPERDSEINSRHFGGGNHRRSKHYDADEPEWLNTGPISQQDTIELRGFDDAEDAHLHDKESAVKFPTISTGSSGKAHPSSKDEAAARTADEDDEAPPPARSTPTKNKHSFYDTNNNMNANKLTSSTKTAETISDKSPDRKQKVGFNFDAFLGLESFKDYFTSEESGSSRFSHWFKRSNNSIDQQHDELDNNVDVGNQPSFMHHAHSSQRDQNPSHRLPHQISSNQFPEPPTKGYDVSMNQSRMPQQYQAAPRPTNQALMEFLAKNNAQPTSAAGQSNINNQNSCPNGAMPSVDELEARMRTNKNPVDALTGAKRSAASTPTPQPHDMEMFRKLITALHQQQQHQQQHNQQLLLQQMLLNQSQTQQQQRTIQQQLQQQLLQLSQSSVPAQNDVLKMPETQGLPQRIPSARELQIHTQSIMHNALIKKLEGQQENYRRRQEIEKMQQHHQQGEQQQYTSHQNRRISSNAPPGFTPTSVLRKMTTGKEGFSNSSAAGGPGPNLSKNMKTATNAMQSLLLSSAVTPPAGAGHYGHQQQSLSRAMVDNRNILQCQMQQLQSEHGGPSNIPQMAANIQRNNPAKWSQFNNMNQFNQQQQKPFGGPKHDFQQPHATQQQPFQLPQHRQRIGEQEFHNLPYRQQGQSRVDGRNAADMTAQSTNRNVTGVGNANTMGGGGATANNEAIGSDGRSQPTGNQLSRWFSPELLAKASAGELPALNMGQALNLEDFERNIHSAAVQN